MFPRPKLVHVTPQLATQLLERNSSNRPVDKSLVSLISNEIGNGNWQVTHQGIALDGPLDSGRVIDGQHRLHAIAKSSSPVPVLIFENVPSETFSVLDQGKRRSGGDVLALSGEKDTTLLAATVRHVHLFRISPSGSWVGSSSRLSNAKILEIFSSQRERFTAAVSMGRTLGKEIGMIPTAASTAYFLTTEAAPAARTEEWVEGLSTGANLGSDDPRLVLIRTIRSLRGGSTARRRTDTKGQVGLYIKAWNAWVAGRSVKVLRLQKGEKMPKPIQMLLGD
ncbi:hypothetical protein [Streptomyces sp. ST2-7A]|uniref:hypothetical protein n=1 Tax=Streptomyces sp. ST2-7A TaxID=2907214 RepID=UPI001F208464|nr:hypothetical protein [Streptomyces sp. ST2-7A]MCE7082810.1 hypothetical protein [Streptomyces sp. ST2-7A]